MVKVSLEYDTIIEKKGSEFFYDFKVYQQLIPSEELKMFAGFVRVLDKSYSQLIYIEKA